MGNAKLGIIVLLLFSSLSFYRHSLAKEPSNLGLLKRELIVYHDSKTYDKEIAVVINQALDYLIQRLKEKSFQKPAIILDVDETAISNYPDLLQLDFGYTAETKKREMRGWDKAIEPTLELYQFAKKHHVAVFFITGREEDERVPTLRNLIEAGYRNPDGLFFRSNDPHRVPASLFKKNIRKLLTQKGYHILMNIGDQDSDLVGGYADQTFKLPNPYYFVP